jgi:hypothetical protein
LGRPSRITAPLSLALKRVRERDNLMGIFGPEQNNNTIGEQSEAIINAKFYEL